MLLLHASQMKSLLWSSELWCSPSLHIFVSAPIHFFLSRLLDFSTAESERYEAVPGMTALGGQFYMLKFVRKHSFLLSAFSSLFVSSAWFVPPVLVDNIYNPSMLDLSGMWGFWALVVQKSSLSPQYTLGFSCFFHLLFTISLLFSVMSI